MSQTYSPRALRASWDRQQNYLVVGREARFEALVTILKVGTHVHPRILDLGCGTGAFSERILREIPSARIWALDYDPVLLRIARDGLPAPKDRLRWIDADLRSPSWTRSLPRGKWDAIVSTTALHWLEPGPLARVYRSAARLLRPGGLFLNGDHLPFDPPNPQLTRLLRRLRRLRRAREPPRGALNWEEWWAKTRRVAELADEFAERDRRYPHEHADENVQPVSWHLRALRASGFRETTTIWQHFANRVVLAIR